MPTPDLDREAALERAAREQKPLVLFARPDKCRAPKKAPDPCRRLEAAVRHPAIQRRLQRVVYLSTTTEEEQPSITVHDPGGVPIVRWVGAPDPPTFRLMLTLVDGAAPNLVAAARARGGGDARLVAREECLATLALGNEASGRARLRALRDADDAETQQLATIWLGRLDARGNDTNLDEVALFALAREGATNQVRFEAWMSIGERQLAEGKGDDAAIAFRTALDLAGDAVAEREAALAALARSAETGKPVIGLGSAGSIVTGRRTIQPRWNEKKAHRVEYRLDGKLVATALQAPFAAGVNFDRIPKYQLLELTAFDRAGDAIRSARVAVNDRSGDFAIQIVEPAGAELVGPAAVELALRVPRGRGVVDVVVEWNGAVAARLDAPPWKTRVTAVAGELGVLRAAVRLDDGTEREDVRLFNIGSMLLESGVHLVEVPVYDANRRLTAGELTVREAGQARQVDRVITASEAPLNVALLLDMSTSMKESVLDLEEAALQFVGRSLEERGRVTLVAFDTTARVALWPTSDRPRIERAIQDLRVRGATALHDAMITAILQLQAGGSRRAIVVLSDALDNASVFSMSDVLEVAKRSAVPIYLVTLNPQRQRPVTPNEMPVVSPEASAQQELARLARRSGGMAFELQSVDRVGSLWKKIAEDIRNQSLVIYRTTADGADGGWRELEISFKGGKRLRAPAGVYIEGAGQPAGGSK
ncbi:MAG: VWA domain-containing protein [Thermoanaerobaculia bacterium]|nr:VWA domain-containing protein [Thermoanaerobaculia bacterium]